MLAKKFIARTRTRISVLVVLAILAFAAISIVGYAATSIYAYGKQTAHTSAQAAIVLGASVWTNYPSPVFIERINHGIALYHTGQVESLLFTGGIGPGETIAESEAAKRYAIAQGVPASDILTESESHTTDENLRFAKSVAEQHHLQSFLIVSDPLHMKRAMAMAEDLRLNALPSPTPTTRYKTVRSQLGFLAHETYFYLDYRCRHLL